MRILIVGAGGVGGAYGTLLHEAGHDVTFLVRPHRAEKIRQNGLAFVSPEGRRTNEVSCLCAGEEGGPFDIVILATKAYGLDGALQDIRPFVTEQTRIIPILNGMAHIDRVNEMYPGQALGGIVKIVATLDGDTVVQMTPLITMTIGSLDENAVPPEIVNALTVPGFTLTVSNDIRAALWEKWAFIASAGIVTCLFRGPVGAIIEVGGLGAIYSAIAEGEAVAAAAGYPVSQAGHQGSLNLLTEEGSAFTSSLYRDVAAGHAHEGEHILGELAEQARNSGVSTPLLDLTLIQIRTGDSPIS